MNGYRIWTDKRANRLHLLIRRSLNKAEIQTAKLRLKQAREILRADFSINIQQELQGIDADMQDPDEFSIIRIKRDLNHILRALQESAA